MVWIKRFAIIIVVGVFCGVRCEDTPCAARPIPGQSVVCVCNSTYCDTVTRESPERGTFVSYTSSREGLRFKKSSGSLRPYLDSQLWSSVTISLHPDTTYQTIEGFGGAFTDAAGINWKNLSIPLQKYLIESYFSKSGLEYNMGRVPVGGTDFSTRGYAYNELPEDDVHLTNFSLAYEDYHFKIPMIKAASQVATEPLHLVATAWSPPPWMKTNHHLRGNSRLKPEYFQTYAEYYYKFLEHYQAAGVPVWGITTTNEPINGLIGINIINSLGWTAESMGRWIVNNLGPKIRNSTFKDVKIIVGDDQRLFLPYWIAFMLSSEPSASQYMDGVGVHYYTDYVTPPAMLHTIMASCPDKFIIATEACEGFEPWLKERVLLGSWDRAHNYVRDIIGDLNHGVIGWIDWNLCLNEEGGPNWVHNYVDSLIIVFPERDELVKQPMFYALGHFSKFVPRGSRRILTKFDEGYFVQPVEHVAFLTTRKTVVVVLYNKDKTTTVNIKLGSQVASVEAVKDSVITVEIPYE